MSPETAHQRRWLRKATSVLNKLPKSVHGKAKADLHAIEIAQTRTAAETAFDAFITSYDDKYLKATQCLAKDQDALLAFFDFPASH